MSALASSLAALLFATPPLAAPPATPTIDVAGIAFRLANTESGGRVGLLKEFKILWTERPWGPKAAAALELAELEGPSIAPTQLILVAAPAHALMAHGGVLEGLRLASLGLPVPIVTRFGLTAYSARTPAAPARLWPLGEEPDIADLQAEVARNDRYAHGQNLVDLARARWRRGEVDLAKARLADAMAALRMTPEVEFDADAWDDAQMLSLSMGDFAAALELLQHRARGRLAALDEVVQVAFDFDRAEHVLAAIPVLFALRPGIDDGEPDPVNGCADAMAPQRWKSLKDWSETLLVNGQFDLHTTLTARTPHAGMREALRGKAVEALMTEERLAAAWAQIAQMGIQAVDVGPARCAGIDTPGELRATIRAEFIDNAAIQGEVPLVLKAVASALTTNEVEEVAWDSVIAAVEEAGGIVDLAALMGTRKAADAGRRDAQIAWVDAMLLVDNMHLTSAVSDTLEALADEADSLTQIAAASRQVEAELRELALPTDDVVTPVERLSHAIELTEMYLAADDTNAAHAALADALDVHEGLGPADVSPGDWSTMTRLSVRLDQSEEIIDRAMGLPKLAARIDALHLLGEHATDKWRSAVLMEAVEAIVAAVAKADTAAQERAACPSPNDMLVEAALEPWIMAWGEAGRFEVAAQVARRMPAQSRGPAMAALVAQVAAYDLESAVTLAATVPPAVSGCTAGDGDPQGTAWLGVLDEALNNGRFGVVTRAIHSMPEPRDIERFSGAVRRLFDRLTEAERVPDFARFLEHHSAPSAMRAVIEREMIRQHLGQGRIGAALAVGARCDRRTRMLLLLAIAGADQERLAPHASAIRALEK